jgi:hypothetical protein
MIDDNDMEGSFIADLRKHGMFPTNNMMESH